MSMYYNKDIKEKYLKTLERNKNYKNIVSLFKRVANYEKILKKDFYEMSLEEYIYVFRQLDISNTQTLDLYKGFLDRYITWCIEEGLTESSPLSYLKNDAIVESGIKRKYLKDKAELEVLLEKAYGDEGHYYKFQELIFHLCWNGFSTLEISKLKKSDVNFDTSVIKNIRVDKNTIDLCRICISLKEARTGKRTVKFTTSPYLIRKQDRGIGDELKVSENYIQNVVHRFKKKLRDDYGIHTNVTLRTILTSGVFTRWIELEKGGERIEDYHLKELRHLLGQPPLDQRGFLRFSRYTLRDYDAYKSTFSYDIRK